MNFSILIELKNRSFQQFSYETLYTTSADLPGGNGL